MNIKKNLKIGQCAAMRCTEEVPRDQPGALCARHQAMRAAEEAAVADFRRDTPLPPSRTTFVSRHSPPPEPEPKPSSPVASVEDRSPQSDVPVEDPQKKVDQAVASRRHAMEQQWKGKQKAAREDWQPICITGHEGEARAGHGGTAVAGYASSAEAGDRGMAIVGDFGSARAGIDGTAMGGHASQVAAGPGGTLILRSWDGQRSWVCVAYVGSDGIEADVLYRLDDDGDFVPANKTEG